MFARMSLSDRFCPSLVVVVVAYTLFLCGVMAENTENTPTNLVGNGNFEDLKGYFPAGVLVRRSRLGRHVVIPHWNVTSRCAPVEIVSSLFWQSSISADQESLYAVHLNTRAGPGSIQTEFSSPFNSNTASSPSGTERYHLSVDVAGNPNGRSSVKMLEVVVSPSECRSQKLSVPVARGANSKKLNWITEHLVLDVHGNPPTVMLQFRSLTPGAYGPLIDNVRLVPLHGGVDKDTAEDGGFCDGNEDQSMEEFRPAKSLVQHLLERMWMSAETWVRQRFFRPDDW
ncbi:unnamed protein product [Calypogeia fissa]